MPFYPYILWGELNSYNVYWQKKDWRRLQESQDDTGHKRANSHRTVLERILLELEQYRLRLSDDPHFKNPEHAVRVCQAIVASKAGYKDRLKWQHIQRYAQVMPEEEQEGGAVRTDTVAPVTTWETEDRDYEPLVAEWLPYTWSTSIQNATGWELKHGETLGDRLIAEAWDNLRATLQNEAFFGWLYRQANYRFMVELNVVDNEDFYLVIKDIEEDQC